MKKQADFLVVGSGIAGLCFAIHAAQYGSVIIITKKKDSESNTNYAQGGIACVLDPMDSFEKHINDTLTTGCGLSLRPIVKTLVEEGPSRIKELLTWGTNFTSSSTSDAYAKLDLGIEGGHSSKRIVHARDLTGKEVEQTLINKVKELKNIVLYENHCLVELVTNHHLAKSMKKNTCFGAYILDTMKRKIVTIRSKTTYLATGGAGQVYQHTTNPAIATGDGLASAYRSGAKINNMEFIQFHPTTLFHSNYNSDVNSFLISEAVRGFGAILKDSKGNEFMKNYHPMKSLAPRDVVARAIDTEMKHSGDPCVYLDIRHVNKKETAKRFPTIYARCKEFGVDITRDLIPVVPASHYICGGITVDSQGNTSIKNLYAGGEVACAGVHGANRLASNSLLEALVFSKCSAKDASQKIKPITLIPKTDIPNWDDSGTVDTEEWVLISHNLTEIKNIMWNYVGIVRSNLRLQRAMRRIKLLEKETESFYRRTRITPELIELRNILCVAKMIIQSALKRKESRGLHYTTDYPKLDNANWNRNTSLIKNIRP